MDSLFRNCSVVERTELLFAYICPGCLGVFDGPGVCDDCGVALTENIIKVSQPHGEEA